MISVNELVNKYPNDQELGAAIRKLFTTKTKNDENQQLERTEETQNQEGESVFLQDRQGE